MRHDGGSVENLVVSILGDRTLRKVRGLVALLQVQASRLSNRDWGRRASQHLAVLGNLGTRQDDDRATPDEIYRSMGLLEEGTRRRSRPGVEDPAVTADTVGPEPFYEQDSPLQPPGVSLLET